MKLIKVTQHDGNWPRPKKKADIFINPALITAIISRVDTNGTDHILIGNRNLSHIKEKPDHIRQGCESRRRLSAAASDHLMKAKERSRPLGRGRRGRLGGPEGVLKLWNPKSGRARTVQSGRGCQRASCPRTHDSM